MFKIRVTQILPIVIASLRPAPHSVQGEVKQSHGIAASLCSSRNDTLFCLNFEFVSDFDKRISDLVIFYLDKGPQ